MSRGEQFRTWNLDADLAFAFERCYLPYGKIQQTCDSKEGMRITEGEGDKGSSYVGSASTTTVTHRGLRTGELDPNGTNRPTPVNHSPLA